MPVLDALWLFAGAVVIGLLHGAEPGHGWPIAATYALDRQRQWIDAILASVLLGLGHLVSSIAVVLAYFLAISYFDLTRLDDPITVYGLQIGGPVSIVAGVMLILLGVREYRQRHGHGHDHGDGHDHSHGHGHDHSHEQGHDHSHEGGHDHGDGPTHDHDQGNGYDNDSVGLDPHESADDEHRADDSGTRRDESEKRQEEAGGLLARARALLPFVGGNGNPRDWTSVSDGTGLLGITWTAFVLGFAHEEEFEIIGLCTGSPSYCLPLMLVYSLAVIVALVALTLGLVAGYERYEERVGQYVPYFPIVSAVVLWAMGIGFVLGLF